MSLAHATHKSIGLFSLSGKTLLGKIVNVYDADTCKIVLDKGDNTLEKYCCRLLGIDTPEMKPSKSNLNRDLEIESAYNARNRLIQLATSCNIELENRLCNEAVLHHVDNSLLLFEDMIKKGVAREQARMILPQNLYTEYYATANLNNILKFIELRTHEGAQWEIQELAKKMLEIIKCLWPETVKSFINK